MINFSHMARSFTHALRGVRVVFVSEQSFRVQVIVALAVIGAGAWFGVSKSEWIVLLLLIAAVLSLEMLNSVIERLVDAFKPRIHPIVKEVKDVMAATVLVISLMAAVIGLMIFYPHFSELVALLGLTIY